MDFCEALIADIPFYIHLVREVPGRMVGKDAKQYLDAFWKQIFPNPPCITVVGGMPGSGKSFCLANISKHLANNPKLGWAVILRLTESHFAPRDLLRKIEGEIGLQADKLGNILEREKKVLCLLVDNVDEYIRYGRAINENTNESLLFLNILRVICAMEQTLHGRFCAVLSITDNVIKTLHLDRQNDPKNAIVSLPQGDRNIRDRYRPVLEPNKEYGNLLLFNEITKDDAAEMIEDCMDVWKARHKEILTQQIPPDCIYVAQDDKQHIIYPFTCGALDIIYEAAGHIPGEVVLGAISSIQQLYEVRKKMIRFQSRITASPQIITESIAALGILQIRRMKERAANIKDLEKRIQSDPSVVFSYIVPQLARKLSLRDIEPRRNLGDPFIEFLGLLGIRLSDPVSKIGFGRTRGLVKPPEFPLFDAKFHFEERKYGVIFLTPPRADPSNIARVRTGACLPMSGGAGRWEDIEKEVDSLLIICSKKDVADWAVAQVNQPFQSGNNPSFIRLQRDWRNCVVVIKVPEEWPWVLKILHKRGGGEPNEILLSDDNVRIQALLLENVSTHFWRSTPRNGAVPEGWTQLRWIDVLKNVEYDPSTVVTDEPSRPDFHMPTG